jgi:hypothetical protein
MIVNVRPAVSVVAVLVTALSTYASVLAPAFADELSDHRQQLDQYAIVLFPLEMSDGANPDHVEFARQFHNELFASLSAIESIHIIGPQLVVPYSNSDLLDKEIAADLGAENFITVRLDKESRGTELSVRVRTVRAKSGMGSGFNLNVMREARRAAQDLAADVEYFVFPDRGADSADEAVGAKAVLLDFERSDEDRFAALRELARGRMGFDPPRYAPATEQALKGAVALAAVELATQSLDARTRAGVWQTMAGVRDPILIEPLLDAVRSDESRFVRVQAARALDNFARDPRVREELESTATYDTDPRVREAARWSLLTLEARWEERRISAMNEDLDEFERKIEFHKLLESHRLLEPTVDEELFESLVSFAANAAEPKTRWYVWFGLSSMCGPEIVTPMLNRLIDEPDEEARTQMAISLISRFIDEPGVREALVEVKESDGSRLVRMTIEEQLQEHETRTH